MFIYAKYYGKFNSISKYMITLVQDTLHSSRHELKQMPISSSENHTMFNIMAACIPRNGGVRICT
jgi:hypothetical protein